MALRSLDNALPTAMDRPKKVAKVTTTPTKASVFPEAPRYPGTNDENSAPLPQKNAEQLVEYISSEDLKALPEPEMRIANLLEELDFKDWVKVCESLNDVRRLALHHSSLLLPILEKVMLVTVKAMKNPRSALCKTAIMACADIFRSCGHHLLLTPEKDSFDNLLLQLLLKASQDKRFVCEEAEKTLQTMAISLSPLPLLKKFQSYVNHTNLRVRAKAAVAISNCVSSAGIEIMKDFGLAALLQLAAELLNDRLPEAREAARSIINSIHGGFLKDMNEEEEEAAELWQAFCTSNLSPISAQSVAKISFAVEENPQ
ncbi:uncharacterized protein [Typha latifolia]|uniref:uncharacterized protein n=1 Tax=Typha latifolia TaxID=4733 RepID=UPI003C2D2516